MLFAPGARESYSNTGYSLLAAIIERVTGKTFDEYVRDNILAPAGLRRTGFLLPAFALTDLAHGYAVDGGDRGTMLAKPHASDGPYWNLRGNGGMLSTVADMHTFYAVLFEGEKLMTSSTRSLRFDPQTPIALAGSDGVNVFLYERFPGMRVELIIASTNAAIKAGAVRKQLASILRLPSDDGEPDGLRTGGVAAPAPIATVLADLVSALNAGDATSLRKFIAEHFASEPQLLLGG